MYSLCRTEKVKYLCALFQVSRSAYYRYRRGKSYRADKKYNRPKHEVEKEFIQNHKRYGSRRIKASLQEKGIIISRRKVASIMRKQGLRAIQPRTFVPRTTNSRHGKRVSPNLLEAHPQVTKPNSVWVSDITYMPVKGGKWAYLCVWLDLFSRRIVSWRLAENMQEILVREPLERALLKRRVSPGMIIRSDRGGQYLSEKMKKLIKTFQLRQSMSGADNPYDNAWAESFWSRLKAELDMPKGGYECLERLNAVLFKYIEGYYNTARLHSALNYSSPIAFETQYYRNTG
ncbi:IS3 family transposase [Pseudarcicella hirudinis]|uniref:IS3 family transposase n=1 Tax=Pseudarcicella hirudinis TaxID=1079859 RepID=UPI001E5D12C5|nr:IS3 family transposase [Pseudarcicella hirudinis]